MPSLFQGLSEPFQAAPAPGADRSDGHPELSGDRGVVGGLSRVERLQQRSAGLPEGIQRLADRLAGLEFLRSVRRGFGHAGEVGVQVDAAFALAGKSPGFTMRAGEEPRRDAVGVPQLF